MVECVGITKKYTKRNRNKLAKYGSGTKFSPFLEVTVWNLNMCFYFILRTRNQTFYSVPLWSLFTIFLTGIDLDSLFFFLNEKHIIPLEQYYKWLDISSLAHRGMFKVMSLQ